MVKNIVNSTISFQTALILSLIAIATYLTVILAFANNVDTKTFTDIGNIIINLFVIIALFCTIRALKSRNDNNYRVWAIFLAAQSAFLMGDVLWAANELIFNNNPFPSVADIFYIAYYPLFIVGIFMIPRVYSQKHRGYKVIIDLGIIIISSLLFFWTFLILPLIETNSMGNLSTFISLLYIALDLVLLFALLDLTFDKIKSIRDWTLILLAGGVASQIIADVIYSYQSTQGTYTSGGILELGWVIGYLLVGLAGLWEANHKLEPRTNVQDTMVMMKRPAWISYLPFLLVIATYGLLSTKYMDFNYQNWIILDIGVGITILLVLFRQIISINENRKLFLQAEKEIQNRKKIEKNLKNERDRAESYFNISGVFMLILDEKGKIRLINRKGCEILGYAANEIMGWDWFEKFVPPQSRGKVKKILANLESKNSDNFENIEYSVMDREGNENIIFWHVSSLNDGGTLSSGEDLTQERKRENMEKTMAQQTILRQDALLQLTSAGDSDLESAFQSLTKVDAETMKVERVSIWYFNKDKTKIICKCLYDQIKNVYESGDHLEEHEYPEYFKAIQMHHNVAADDALTDPLTYEFSENYLKPLKIFSLLDVPIWLKGDAYGILCHEKVGEKRIWTFEDQNYAAALSNLISIYLESDERRQAEESIKLSLAEKEILLQEIHHRVKNNMQIISSMLSLQSRYIDDEKAFDVFQESQNRVKSMAIIHEKLYESKNLDQINMVAYINSLVSNLRASYLTSPPKIKIKTRLDDVYLNMDTAIPIGLILNELITNSLKHAFPPDSFGEININMKYKEEAIEITVSDNGVGIPKNFDLNNTNTLGLMLINSLVNQIDGTIKLHKDAGTCFKIKFKEIKPPF